MERTSTLYSNQEWLDEVYDKLLIKMKAECTRIGAMIPFAPKDGQYFDVEATPLGIGFWTNGFWPGMLWQMYQATGDEDYRKVAESVETRLDVVLKSFDGIDHDAGFIFLLSSVANYRKTGNKESRRGASTPPICLPVASIRSASTSGLGTTTLPMLKQLPSG